MTTFSDNLSAFLKREKISVRSLEQRIGCSNGVLARCISKRTDISSTWVSKIINTFPKLNPTWLLTGEGDMYKQGEATPEKHKSAESTSASDNLLLQYLREKDDEIGRLREEIGGLKEKQKTLEQNVRKNDYLIAEPAEFSGAAEP